MKNKGLIIFLALLGLGFLIGMNGCSTYNGFVSKEEAVKKSWNNVESQYQRRADLIPNLVSTVKGYAAHERETFESVTQARAAATQVKVDVENLDPEAIEKFSAAQQELSKGIGRLLAVSENYPELKANDNFKELQSELAGTENRIQVARMDFNEAVNIYNTSVRKFPGKIWASLFDFSVKEGFKAEAGSEKAPKVEF